MIELISTITTKNKGNYAIALSNEIKGGLHSVGTAKDRDNISTARLQDGMLCWVVDEQLYYQWINNEWTEFSVGGGGEGNSYIYRVTTYEDMIHLKDNPDNIIDFGTLCHVVNDTYKKYMYYYGVDGWSSFTPNTLIHIGDTPPNGKYPNYMLKNILWVDTSVTNSEGYGDNDIPTFLDPPLMQYLIEQNASLTQQLLDYEKRLLDVERKIEEGWQGSGDGDSGGGSVDKNSYLATEDGDVFITEEGDKFITEDSDTSGGSGGNSGGSNVGNNLMLTEDGKYLITEDGKNFMIE